MKWLIIFLFGTTIADASPCSISVRSDHVLVSIKAQLWTEDSLIDHHDLTLLARLWTIWLNEIWNQETLKAVNVRFQFLIKAPLALENDAHLIEVRAGEESEYGEFSAVSMISHSPCSVHQGIFPSRITPHTLAHEFGHFMGLADEYRSYLKGSPIPNALEANGVTLNPVDAKEFGDYVMVSYGRLGLHQGLMAKESDFIPFYYLSFIFSHLEECVQNLGRPKPSQGNTRGTY